MLNADTDYIAMAERVGLYDSPKNNAVKIPDNYYADDPAYNTLSDFPKAKSKPKRMVAMPIGMSVFTPKRIDWLIKDIMPTNRTGVVFGESGGGKTFAIIDMLLHIATGKDWHGHSVKQGKVLYIAGEGEDLIAEVLAAWAQVHGHHQDIANNFLIVNVEDNGMVYLPDHTSDIIDIAADIPDLRIIVFDTLSVTFSPKYDPNLQMSVYTGAMIAIRKALSGVSVFTIHHTGHSDKGRERNGGEIRGNLDISMRVFNDQEKHVCLESKKAKGRANFETITFDLNVIEIEGWLDEDRLVTSCVLRHLDGVTPSAAQKLDDWRAKVTGSNQKSAMTILETLYQAQRRNLSENGHDSNTAGVTVDHWITDCVAQFSKDKTYKPSYFKRDVLTPLIDKGVISIPNGSVYVHIVGEKISEKEVRNGEK